jgi:hypothetical protein
MCLKYSKVVGKENKMRLEGWLGANRTRYAILKT